MKIIKRILLLAFSTFFVINVSNVSAHNAEVVEPMVAISSKMEIYSREYFRIGNTDNESEAIFDIIGWVELNKSGDYIYVYDYYLTTKTIKSSFSSFQATILNIDLVDIKNNLYECTVRVKYGYKLEKETIVKYKIVI